MPRLLRWVGLGLAGVALLAGLAAWQGLRVYRAPGPLPDARQLVIPRGGIEEIGDALVGAGIVAKRRDFALAAWLTRRDGQLRAAEFAFPAHASLQQVLDILRHARPVQRRLTIPEGLTSQQITALLNQAEGLTGQVPSFAEGSVLPETYAYQWGDERAALLRRAETAMGRLLAELWAKRAPNLPLSSPGEAVTLASIVERETAQPEERPRVAAVFLNRLRRGMRLQSDPTVAYATTGGAAMDRALSRADLDQDSPYNTYRIPGLPPGPIAAPGREALRAVLNPPATEDLYFVADGSGGHAFARTLEEHNRNVARWREIERQRGGGTVPAPAPRPR